MRPFEWVTGSALAAFLLAATGTAAASAGSFGLGHPPAPPPEAYQACSGSQEGAACSVTHGERQMNGSCRSGPGGTALACVPDRPPPHGMGPPPESIQACSGQQAGVTCSFTHGSEQISGTCRNGPDGSAVACVPDDMRPF
jgi:hypothetical protein